MAGFKVLGLNHTGVVVTDMDRAIGFFRDLLGFELLSRGPRDNGIIQRMTGVADADMEVVHLQGPAHRVELIRYGATAARGTDQPAVVDDGSAHIAVDVDDAEAAVEASRHHGLALVGEIIAIDAGPNKGRKVCYLESPYGLCIEFIGAPGA